MIQKSKLWDFTGGSVVKNAGDTSSISDMERSRTLHTTMEPVLQRPGAHVTQLLKSEHPRVCAPQQEKPTPCNEKQPLVSATRERHAQQGPSIANNKQIEFKNFSHNLPFKRKIKSVKTYLEKSTSMCIFVSGYLSYFSFCIIKYEE